jgi:hypothetical protein
VLFFWKIKLLQIGVIKTALQETQEKEKLFTSGMLSTFSGFKFREEMNRINFKSGILLALRSSHSHVCRNTVSSYFNFKMYLKKH